MCFLIPFIACSYESSYIYVQSTVLERKAVLGLSLIVQFFSSEDLSIENVRKDTCWAYLQKAVSRPY